MRDKGLTTCESPLFSRKAMSTVILKYPAGNIFSVKSALARLGVDSEVTCDENALRTADRVIIPGQGEAAVTMDWLRRNGVDGIIRSLRQPVLGICIGMQLMCESSSEGGGAECLGIFPRIKVSRFNPEKGEKIPHMGWNSISGLRGKLFSGVAEGSYVYFVHSYRVPVCEYTTAQSEYCGAFSAAIERGNFMAVQFHPEKSGTVGETILRNFLKQQ